MTINKEEWASWLALPQTKEAKIYLKELVETLRNQWGDGVFNDCSYSLEQQAVNNSIAIAKVRAIDEILADVFTLGGNLNEQ
jgi:hypothetical protein